MSARIIFREYGAPKVLEVEEVEPAEPGAGQVRIRTEAIGVNPFDWKVVAGVYKSWFPVTFPSVPGGASAGVIDAVGEGVTEFAVGDPVISDARHAFQQHIVTATKHVIGRPASVDVDQAAALPVSATTGYALVEQVGVGADDLVLVHGGSGPVGAAAVQIAVSRGATVIATASVQNHDYLRSIGATPVAYGEGLVESVRAIGEVTAVIATADGEAVTAATKELLPDLGRAVTAASDQYSEAARLAAVEHPADELAQTVQLAADGVIVVRIGEVLPLAQVADAFEHSYKGTVKGKILLRP